MVTVENKLKTLQEISETHTLNEEYENFVTAHIKKHQQSVYQSNQDSNVKSHGSH